MNESMEQGFVVTGVSYYLQAWCVEMKGPVFCAAWLPLYSVFTMFCSSFLGEIVHLGRLPSTKLTKMAAKELHY